MTTWIGNNHQRIDAESKVRGTAQFPGDINLPHQAYLKIRFANRPHAIIKSIDVSAAEQTRGVIAVLTAKDVPLNEYGLIINDQPVLCGPGSTKTDADRVRFVGDQIAVVIAETERIAEEAVKKIDIFYEDLPLVVDPLEAIQESSFILHPSLGSNIFCHYRIRKGDIENAFLHSDVIVEGTYRTPVQEHAYLQPEAGLGYIDENGRITVVVGGQWTHEDQEQIAHALALPPERIRVVYPAIGGAFGGREDMSIQIILALAANKLAAMGIQRPVKIIWNREESIIGHHKRHSYIIQAKWGATKEGILTAAEMKLVADGGAYAYTSSKVLGNATLLCVGPYEIPNVKVDSFAVYTNNIPGGAFRGFGGPQANFAAEMQISRLAKKIGLDPVEMRSRNLVKDGSLLPVGTALPKGVSIDRVVSQCAEAAGWHKNDQDHWQRPKNCEGHAHQPPLKRKGVGFACGYKNVGFSFGANEHCWATIELHGQTEVESVIIRHAAADVGQGSHTVICQMAAEALQVDPGIIKLIAADTAQTNNSGSVSASRMTFMAGNSIRMAAKEALERWKNEERPVVVSCKYVPPRTTPMDPQTGKSEPNFAYGYVAEAIEVEVDLQTGQITIGRVICVNDVGRAINPQLIEGQIEGAVVQAAGYAYLENFIQKNGYVVTDRLSKYLIPTIMDIPSEVRSLIVETPDPIGPWGARGMGEMPYLPFASAFVAAVNDATGVWFEEFPLTPERVMRGLGRL